jgi:hypothetical protein
MEETKSIKHCRKRAVKAAQGDQAVTRVNIEHEKGNANAEPVDFGRRLTSQGQDPGPGERTQRAKEALREPNCVAHRFLSNFHG